jgi:predicted nucleic acid-binding protein
MGPFGPPGVLDANGIIGLAKGGCFSLIPHLFSALYVPSLVVPEITDQVSQAELATALRGWLREEAPTGVSLGATPPHKGEADRHVLALAIDHRPALIVTGDRGLQNKAKQLLVATIDAPTVVRLLVEANLIPAAKPHLDQMRLSGFGIPQLLYEEILRALGE